MMRSLKRCRIFSVMHSTGGSKEDLFQQVGREVSEEPYILSDMVL